MKNRTLFNFVRRKFAVDLTKYDKTQSATFTQKLISVDVTDRYMGAIDKTTAHLNEYIKLGLPHRAFSVFLFNQNNELLMQKRSNLKITFPLRWTNTCCSHPLDTDEEAEENNDIGIKKAAISRLNFELRIKGIEPDDLKLVQKVRYSGPSCPDWGEYEGFHSQLNLVDYIFFAKKDFPTEIGFNPDEIESIHWLNRHKVYDFIQEKKENNVLKKYDIGRDNSMVSENFRLRVSRLVA